MEWIAISVIALLILINLSARLLPEKQIAYAKIPTLFSPAERSFLDVLDKA